MGVDLSYVTGLALTNPSLDGPLITQLTIVFKWRQEAPRWHSVHLMKRSYVASGRTGSPVHFL